MAALAACSGGGGGGDGSWLTFTPSRVTVDGYDDGVPVAFSVIARSRRTFDRVINIAVVDVDGRIDPNVRITGDGLLYTATLMTSPSLAAGTYEGNLRVRLCFDDPASCLQPVDGSPWTIPYTFNIRGPDLRPLEEIAGVPSWSTDGGNASHLPRIAASFDPGRASRRWWTLLPASSTHGFESETIVIDAGRVFLEWGNTQLLAFDEDGGALLWTLALDVTASATGVVLTGPAAAHGQVYVAALDSERVWALDAETGHLRWTIDLPAGARPWPSSPTPYLDHLFIGYRDYSKAAAVCFAKIQPSDGALVWTACPIGPQTLVEGVPVIRDGLLFVATTNRLVALRTDDGSKVWDVAVAYDTMSPSAPAAVGASLVCTRSGSACVDVITQGVTPHVTSGWIAGSTDDTVFDIDKDLSFTVRARDAVTGDQLWSVGSSSFVGPTVIVTEGLLFTGADVIDTTTHAVLPRGVLSNVESISSRGVGYYTRWVPNIGYRLEAVNLR